MNPVSKLKSYCRAAREKISELKDEYVLCRIFINKYVIVFLVFIFWIAFFDNNSAGVFFRANSTIRKQTEQIDNLKKEIKSTELRIEQLNSQKDTLERFAREEYLFHEKDETVYILK